MVTDLDYYQTAAQASQKIHGHPGLEYLYKLSQSEKRVLDVGCGEGTRLNTLLPQDKSGWGVDISSEAIAKAKKNYPRHKFQVADAQKLPFASGEFDVVYSAFALEHSSNPEKFIQEMIRVCRKGGWVVILCPNFGAPNRRSPNSTENPIAKLLIGLMRDLVPTSGLNWTKVKPKERYTHIDDDTTVEPYILSLVRFLSHSLLKIVEASSMWAKEENSREMRKVIIRQLGKWGVFPFQYWGPQIFVAGIKV